MGGVRVLSESLDAKDPFILMVTPSVISTVVRVSAVPVISMVSSSVTSKVPWSVTSSVISMGPSSALSTVTSWVT